MKRLIECVPNFSEGRDLIKVDALVDAMSGVPGAFILDRTSDADHNRSVITLAGEPEAVAEAAIRGVGAAAELIDLNHHSGAHPRIGATDVLPFIPLEGVSMEDCVAIARRVGRAIWDRYRIPVYFYEAAATRPERAPLENIRRGQFEGLREDALRDPDRSPDIGEPRLHSSAGAIAVGVRKILIAYNVHLNTNDVSIAKKIAKAIRYSSGGLRYVKAIGLNLKSRNVAQVSINLTDFEQTPLHRVFEMVTREAERHGRAITGSEIIGLIPRKAIELSAEYFLQLENFSPALVLEERLAGAMATSSALAPETGRRSTIDSVLSELRHALTSAMAEEPSITSGRGRTSEPEHVEHLMETALHAVQIFEQAVQLETVCAPSTSTDVSLIRRMAGAAAEAALENLALRLASWNDSGENSYAASEFVARMRTRADSIQSRLSANQLQNRTLDGEDQ